MTGNRKGILWLLILTLLLSWTSLSNRILAVDLTFSNPVQDTPVQGQGSPDGSGQEQGSPDGSGQEQGSPDGSGQEQGFPDGSGQEQGSPDGSGQEQGSPDGSNQEQGSPDGSGQEQGFPDGSNQEQGSPDGSNQEQGSPDGSGQEQGSPDGSNQEQGSPDGSNQEQGSPDGSNQEQGSPDGSNQEQGPVIGGGPPEIPSDEQTPPQQYTESLGTRTLGQDELVSYTTVSPQFANSPYLTDDLYPGELTVIVDGIFTVGTGASLAIGTMSVGNTEECSPLLQGQGGQIIVQPGGELKLTNVNIDGIGDAPLIVQQSGGIITVQACQLPEEAIQWADTPMVDNSNQTSKDIWLIEGTPFTPDMLPAKLNTDLNYRGQSDSTTLDLEWDISPYQGQTTGSITFTGHFLDENGAVLASRFPLTLTVHWYPAETLVVTQADWVGAQTCTARLVLQEIPWESDEVWGEVSEDGGTTWTIWDNCDLLEYIGDEESRVLVFVMPDDTPRLYRAAAESWFGHQYWVSEEFLLPAENSDDQGGNRGGSTLPDTPDRTPAPVPEEPSPTPEQVDTSQRAPGTIQPRPTQQAIRWVVPCPSDPDSGQSSLHTPPAASSKPTPDDHESASPLPSPAASQESQIGSTVSPVPAGTVEPPAPSQELGADTAAPSVPPASQEPASFPSSPPSPAVGPASQSDGTHPFFLQAGLVAAGLALCILVGAAVAGMGPFRRKQ